jgi:hypothetical protein
MIVTQFPLKDTVVDFVRMVWELDIKTLVLLEDTVTAVSSMRVVSAVSAVSTVTEVNTVTVVVSADTAVSAVNT